MKLPRSSRLASLVLALSAPAGFSATFDSAGSGDWSAAAPGTWNPPGHPQTGSTDSVNILSGHTVTFTGNGGVGLPGSGDLGVANNQSINIDGGVLTQTQTGWWVRIGQGSAGTLNINDGRFHFTDGTGTGTPNMQVGIRGGDGIINIGDGVGAAGSAVLNLRDLVDGSFNNVTASMNLGAAEGGQPNGNSGIIVINSDGLLISDRRITGTGASDPAVRVGQSPTASSQSSITINAGGQFRAHGAVEIGSQPGADGNRSRGLIDINGAGARMDQDAGLLVVGFNGDGTMNIRNNGVYQKVNTPGARQDIEIGREAAAVGVVTVSSGGQLIRGAGGDVADLRIGLRGTGTMNVNDGGLVLSEAGNWDWVGQQNGSNGTLTINEGGTFRTTGGSNMNVGVDTGATGLLHVNGGLLDLQNTGAAQLRVGQNGNGTFRQSGGISSVSSVVLAENSGNATFEMHGGTFSTRAQFFMGGSGTASGGTGTATATQTAGEMNIGGAFVVGIAANHTGVFNLNGGQLNHTGSDTTIGESGTGTMTIGADGILNDTSGGSFFVGRNNGSSGTLWVNGILTRSASNAIRVGNGNSGGVDNTDGTGVLGGNGFISSTAGGIIIGSQGTITAGNMATTGNLEIEGNLGFSAGGQFFVNVDAGGTSDTISLIGSLDITNALLVGAVSGGPVEAGTLYWLLINDGSDAITGSFANLSGTSEFEDAYPAADGWVTLDGQEFAVFYSGDFATQSLTGGNDLVIAAIPEPGNVALVGLALALTALRRRRS